jgi:hypothetical protein
MSLYAIRLRQGLGGQAKNQKQETRNQKQPKTKNQKL